MKLDIHGIEPTSNGEFHVRRADGALVSRVDPVTRQATGEPQAFRVAGTARTDGTVRSVRDTDDDRPSWLSAPKTIAQMSSAERSRLTEDMIGVLKAMEAQAEALTTADVALNDKIRLLILKLHQHATEMQQLRDRLATLELESVAQRERNASLLARVSWILRGR